MLSEKGEPKALITPSECFFDSDLTEWAPLAVLTDKGTLLLYNGKNNPEKGGKRFNANAYCSGQVLFDKAGLARAIGRLDVPFLRPMELFEKNGQYVDGTVFIQGLVYFGQKWIL